MPRPSGLAASAIGSWKARSASRTAPAARLVALGRARRRHPEVAVHDVPQRADHAAGPPVDDVGGHDALAVLDVEPGHPLVAERQQELVDLAVLGVGRRVHVADAAQARSRGRSRSWPTATTGDVAAASRSRTRSLPSRSRSTSSSGARVRASASQGPIDRCRPRPSPERSPASPRSASRRSRPPSSRTTITCSGASSSQRRAPSPPLGALGAEHLGQALAVARHQPVGPVADRRRRDAPADRRVGDQLADVDDQAAARRAPRGRRGGRRSVAAAGARARGPGRAAPPRTAWRTRSCSVTRVPSASAKERLRSQASAWSPSTPGSTAASRVASTARAIAATATMSWSAPSSSAPASRPTSVVASSSSASRRSRSSVLPASSASAATASGQRRAAAPGDDPLARRRRPRRRGRSSSARESGAGERRQPQREQGLLPAVLEPAGLGRRAPGDHAAASRRRARARGPSAAARRAPRPARRCRAATAPAARASAPAPRSAPPGRGRCRARRSAAPRPGAAPARRPSSLSSALLPIPPGPCTKTTLAGWSGSRRPSRRDRSASRPTNRADSRRSNTTGRLALSVPGSVGFDDRLGRVGEPGAVGGPDAAARNQGTSEEAACRMP